VGILDRLRGMGNDRSAADNVGTSGDERAIARYHYLLRTAPPETIEQAHAEAFRQLTPDQRRRVLQQISTSMSAGERMAAARAGDDAEVLARMATRAEIRQPGTLERAFGGPSAFGGATASGAGSMLASGFFAGIAGSVLGSMIAQQFFTTHAPPGLALPDGGPSHDASSLPDAGAGLVDDPFKHAGIDPGEALTQSGAPDAGDGGIGPDEGFGGGDFGSGDFDGDSFDT
jgi:hypothetical protein